MRAALRRADERVAHRAARQKIRAECDVVRGRDAREYVGDGRKRECHAVDHARDAPGQWPLELRNDRRRDPDELFEVEVADEREREVLLAPSEQRRRAVAHVLRVVLANAIVCGEPAKSIARSVAFSNSESVRIPSE